MLKYYYIGTNTNRICENVWWLKNTLNFSNKVNVLNYHSCFALGVDNACSNTPCWGTGAKWGL